MRRKNKSISVYLKVKKKSDVKLLLHWQRIQVVFPDEVTVEFPDGRPFSTDSSAQGDLKCIEGTLGEDHQSVKQWGCDCDVTRAVEVCVAGDEVAVPAHCFCCCHIWSDVGNVFTELWGEKTKAKCWSLGTALSQNNLNSESASELFFRDFNSIFISKSLLWLQNLKMSFAKVWKWEKNRSHLHSKAQFIKLPHSANTDALGRQSAQPTVLKC